MLILAFSLQDITLPHWPTPQHLSNISGTFRIRQNKQLSPDWSHITDPKINILFLFICLYECTYWRKNSGVTYCFLFYYPVTYWLLTAKVEWDMSVVGPNPCVWSELPDGERPDLYWLRDNALNSGANTGEDLPTACYLCGRRGQATSQRLLQGHKLFHLCK